VKNYAAIIFDLDGTLVNSVEDIADCMNRVLLAHGYPTHSYSDFKLMVGEGLKNLTERCLPKNELSDSNIACCFSKMMEEYGRHYAEKSHLYSGISELLDAASKAGVKMSILSNKADELTQKICSKLLNHWKFELILGHGERFPRKPNPSSAMYIAQSLNLQPENILYMGDTAVDMKTANAAGMFSVGVTWGFREREELEANGAKLIINSPQELINLFS
jgi:phosphoglycolate phosphatase